MTLDDSTRAAYRLVNEWNFTFPPGTPVLAWPGTRDEQPLRTRTRSGAWVLGSGEPVVSVVGHAGGIHLGHVEPDPARQPAVPDVEFEMPPCPICGDALDSDGDQLTCLPCQASWARNGTGGHWYDADQVRCPATRSWDRLPDEQCILAAGHDANVHRGGDGFGEWTDDSDCALLDSDGEPTA